MIGRLAFSVTHRLRHSESLRLLPELADEPYRTPQEVRRRQFARLSRLLAHAERTVPYYRQAFAEARIRSEDIRSIEDLAMVPILTKEIVRERADDLISEQFDRRTLVPHHSGGSTGQPLSFYHDPAYIAASDAGTYRNLCQCGWKPGDMVAFFWGWNKQLYAMSRPEFELRQWLRRQYQFDSFRAGDEAFEQWLTTWRRIRPAIVYGYASAIAEFADYVVSSARKLPVRGVFTTAEKLLPQQRAQMEAAFECRVFDCYGSSEVRNIATQCASGSMHVNADFVVLETLPADGDGEGPTPFLLTSLRSYAMPFIRYRNDDCGSLLDGSCDCGSGFPLMQLDIARTSDHFMLPGGKLVHGLFFIHRLYGSSGVRDFQFHQTGEDQIVLYAVRAKRPTGFEASIARAVEDIRQLSPGPLSIDVREVDAIPLSAAGKHRYVRSDIAAR